jgi:Fe-S oxidoreductase
LRPERLYRALRRAGGLSALADTGIVRGLIERALDIDRRRPMIEVAPRTLVEEHRARGGAVVDGPPPDELPADTVLFWADCHTDHLDVEAGLAAIELIEMLGFDVRLVAGPCCGRAAESQGRLAEARTMSRSVIEGLEPWIAAGAEVVGLEPSCVACITEDAVRLLGEASPALLVGTATKEVLRFVEDNSERLEELLMAEQLERDLRGGPEAGAAPRPRRLVVHGHCQQKAAGWFPATLDVLARLPGVEVVPTRAECCGMAGSWGYKTDWYAVSRELGYRLIAEIDEIESVTGPADEVMACGTSCRAQLGDLGGRRPRHPVQLVAELVREARERARRERSGG